MPRHRLCLVNLTPAQRDIARTAASQIFPDAELLETTSLEDAEKTPAHDEELLVLQAVDALTTHRALQALNRIAFPRWAVVVIGGEKIEHVTTVAPSDWQMPLAAYVFRSARSEHTLRCENLRLRGDLKTVARRISHDLRSPVGCVHTSSDVLLELQPSDGPTLLSMAEMIKQSSGEISQIIDRVSFVLQASANSTVPAKLDMGEVVSAVLHQLEEPVEKARASVAQPPSWPEVTGVAAWLQVVWSNLVGNALVHGGPAPQVTLGWTREDGHYRFTVDDRGPGVAPVRLGGLFTRFEQLHSVRVHGLGLSIVQRLVTLQGGTCGHEKKPDGSTSFHFTLPAAG